MPALRVKPSITRRQFLTSLALAPCVTVPLYGETKAPEYAVKAAFLYHFAKFVTWPPDVPPNDPFIIGVYGNDPFNGLLEETVANQKIAGQRVNVRSIAKVQEAKQCRSLFIAASEEHRLPVIIDSLRERPVLTVSDIDGFVDAGGIIGFVQQGNRLRFAINFNAATAAHLKISSQLLELAIEVRR